MTRNVLNAINTARKAFEIESFPGDFFERLMMGNYIDKYKLLLFKEDIDKLSGFIGYGVDGFAVICVNYKRPVGHQNFTLAHEVGHWFLHKLNNGSNHLWYTSRTGAEMSWFFYALKRCYFRTQIKKQYRK